MVFLESAMSVSSNIVISIHKHVTNVLDIIQNLCNYSKFKVYKVLKDYMYIKAEYSHHIKSRYKVPVIIVWLKRDTVSG